MHLLLILALNSVIYGFYVTILLCKNDCFSIKILIFVEEENKQFKYMARTKKIESTPVRIRFKELENGNKSIYLDIY